MADTLDTLQIDIASNASKATQQIRKLAEALGELKSTGATAALKDLNETLKSVGGAGGKIKAASGMTEVEEGAKKAKWSILNLSKALKKLNEKGVVNVKSLGLSEFGTVVKGAFHPITRVANSFKNLTRAMGRIALYRAMRTAIKEITQAAKEGVGNLYQWSAQIGGATVKGKTFADIMDAGAASLQYLKNALGSALGSIMMSFGTSLDGIADKIVELINRFNNLLAVMRGEGSYNKAIRNNTKFAESANKAAKAIKNLVFGFDELNIIPAQTASGSGTEQNFAEMFEETAVDQTDPWIAKLEELKSKWEEYSSAIASIQGKIISKATAIILACAAAVAAMLGHPKIAAVLLGTAIGISALSDNWENVNGLGQIIGKLTSNAIKIITIAGAAYLALMGHPFLAAALFGIGLAAAGLVNAWDGTLSGLPGLIGKLTGYAVAIAAITGGLYLALHGSVIPGLALMAVGVTVGIATASWDQHSEPLSALANKLAKIVLPSALILGGIYAMIRGHIVLGIGLLAAAGVAVAMQSGDGWEANVEKVVGGVKKVWDGVTGFWNTYIAPVFTKAWWTEKWDSILGTFDDWNTGIKTKFEALKTSFKDGAKGMINGLIEKFNAGAEKINNSGFLSGLNSIGGGIFGDNFKISIPVIPKLAEGGIPQLGTMFIAGEAGPEFVGNVGGQTQVYNEDQLANTLASSNEGLINTILAAANALIGAIEDKDLNVSIGDRDIAESARRGARLNGRAMVV